MKYTSYPFLKGDYRITQVFGNNPDYYKQFGFAGHEGIDYGTPNGTELFSPFDGIIVRDVDDAKQNNYGIHLVVWDPEQKCAFWFCHLQDNLVSAGDKVKKGQLVGHTNNTGNTSGPHLHVNFCETDATGNRINTQNGYKGFVDAKDYVQYLPLSPDPLTPPSAPQGTTIDLSELDHTTALDEVYGVMELQQVKAKFRAKDQAIESWSNSANDKQTVILNLQADIKKLKDDTDATILNLQNQLSFCQNKESGLSALIQKVIEILCGNDARK